MEPKLSVDVSHLSETERQTIYGVLKRDEDLRKRDEQRINRLKSELQYLRRRGAIRGGSDPLTSCGRCRSELGKIINRGAPCVVCRAKICKVCRIYAKDGSQWICVVCHKQLELEAATGEWMNEFVRRASRKRDKRGFVPPSDIVKELIVRSQSESGYHGSQEKERPRRGPALVVTGRPASHMEQRSPAVRRRNSVTETPPDIRATAMKKSEERGEEEEAPGVKVSPRRSSEVPVPAPRQKSPLLKQRAVLVEGDPTEQHQRAPTPIKRQAPPPPLIQHPSDQSDSGIGAECGGSSNRSPKTSQSSSTPSRQSSGNSSGQGPWNSSTPAESQTATTDSAASEDLSDSEVEPSTGVVFRKVTLKRRKRRDLGGAPKVKNGDDGRRSRFIADWEESFSPAAPPWNFAGASYSLPRVPSSHSRSSPVSQLQQQLAWDGLCDQLTRTNSSDSLWWDAATCRSGATTSVWLAVDSLGLAPGLSRSLTEVNGAQSPQWSAAETPFRRRGSARFEWRRSSVRGIGGSLRVKRRRHRCRLSTSYEDLRVSSPEYEEDFPLDFGCSTLRNADSYSDILGHVTDKIVPEGEEYRIVFISSSSSKSSGLNSADGDAVSSDDGFRVQLMDGDADWDCDSASSAPSSPPPLPVAPPPRKQTRHIDAVSVEDRDIFTYFRGFADAEWKETSVVVAEESEYDEDAEDSSERPPREDLSLAAQPFFFTRTNSSRSSGERSIGEQSFFNQIFRDQTSPILLQDATETLQPGSVTLAEEEKSGCGSSSGGDDPLEAVDSSDDDCVYGSYDVNVSFGEEEDASASEAEEPAIQLAGEEEEPVALLGADTLELPSGGYLTESESIVGFVELSEEETTDGGSGSDEQPDEETRSTPGFLEDLAIPDVQHDSIQRLLDDVEAACQVVPETPGPVNIDSGISESEESETLPELVLLSIISENEEVTPNDDGKDSELVLHAEKDDGENLETNVDDAPSGQHALEVSLAVSMGDETGSVSKGQFERGRAPNLEILQNCYDEKDEDCPPNTSVPPVIVSTDVELASDLLNKNLLNEGIRPHQEIGGFLEKNIAKSPEWLDGGPDGRPDDGPSQLPENGGVVDNATTTPEEYYAEIPENHLVGGPTQLPESRELPDVAPSIGEEVSAESKFDVNESETEIADGPDGPLLKSTDSPKQVFSPINDSVAVGANVDADEDGHGETSSDGEKLESDTDSLDTVIEGESFRRMRQIAIRQKLLEVNGEFDAETVEAHEAIVEPSSEEAATPSPNPPEMQDGSKLASTSKPNLQELVAQSRALAASFNQSDDEASGSSGGAGGETSVLEKYFVSSLEHLAPPAFNRSRLRHPQAAPKIDGAVAASPSPTLSASGDDEIIIQSYQAGSEDEEFTDSCSETQSENNFNGPIVSGDEDSETTFDEDDDSSSTASTSSDEGTACLRVAPRPCTAVVDESWYRLDMSLHTIMEESCEESESERERHLEDRKRARTRGDADRSQLERYFQFTFDESASTEASGEAPKVAEEASAASKSDTPLSRVFGDDSEFSDDAFSETESSVFSESNDRDGAEVDDEELARLASSRLEKYFLTGLLELQVGYPEDDVVEEELVTTPTPEAEQPSPVPYTFSNKPDEAKTPTPLQKARDKVTPADLSSKEETDEDIPFEKNDGCDTIKRKKKSNLGLEDDDLVKVIMVLREPEQVVSEMDPISAQTNAANSDLPDVPADNEDAEPALGNTVTNAEMPEVKGEASTKEVNQISVASPVVILDDIPEAHADKALTKTSNNDEKLKDALNELNLVSSKDPPRSLPASILDPEQAGVVSQLLSWDPSYYDSGEAIDPRLVGRGLTLDWKQQSRDSGFIGSSDDLLQDGAGDELKNIPKETSLALGDAIVVLAAVVPPPPPQPPTTTTAAAAAATNPFGLFRSSSTRSNFYAASTTSDDEAQYIVNQLVGHIAKSMSRSPQLARAKPPEIEVFETELTKLMQTVPGIDATVKEIVEELSSTDYCSDSYESSDYAGSDQEASAEATKQTLFNLQLRRNDSWRSIASTVSKSSSVGPEDGQKLPEETMYIYQRFMDSLAKMTEQASEEAKTSDAAGAIGGSVVGAVASRGSSPPTPVKMLHHIRSKLTSLMREVHADKSPPLGSAEPPRRIIAWSKPSSGSSSAAGDELSLSSTSSANFDSEDSPTDTEISMDSADEKAVAALAQARAQVQRSAAPASGHRDIGSGDGLERWSSDMTIVDDDVRYSSVHKSEPILSLPESVGEDSRRHSRDLGLLSRTLPSSRLGLGSPPSNPAVARQAAVTQRPRSIGSLTHLITGNKPQCRPSKSEWEVWRGDDSDAAGAAAPQPGSASSLVSVPRAPYKHKSCDMLPSARSKSELRASAAATSRDRKKHGFTFMMRQKSGSSASLRDGDGKSIKQQIQFGSSAHLQQSGKPGKEDLTAPHQPRSSSLHRLFGTGKASKKPSAGSSPSVKSCWSSPDVGVDVTTAAGVDLSDSDGSSSRPSSARVSSAGANVTSIYVPSGAYSTQDLSTGANPRAKASTLPRAASSDLRANVSFLHKPPACRNLTTTNTLPHSYTLLVPQQEAARDTGKPQRQQSTISATKAAGSTAAPPATAGYGAKTAVQVVVPESPNVRRETQSWPVTTDGTGDVPISEVTMFSVSGQRPTPRAKSLSPPGISLKYGSHVPSIQVAECPERTTMRGSGASSHTGSSDPDSMTEEDIDRLVALHKNRSLSSLGVCSESMSSVYSAAGGGHYGTVTVRGEVQFGLSYNYVSGALEVHIKQCRDLAPVDAKRNRSDPYVKVYLLPDKSKSGKRKTRVKKHTLNPMFNEILKFHVTISELETRTLWMTVWHSDMFGRNEFLGEVTLPMGYEAWDDTSPKWYILQERLGPPEEVYSYKGDLVLALKFVPPDVTAQKKGRHSKGSLHVLVKEARNLMAVCTNGTSDPFCKCYLLPDKGKSNKQKTHVVKRSCNPKWNYTFVYDDISLDQLRERCLELTIWDYDRLTSNDFLGGVRLSLGTGRHQGKKVDWIDSRAEEISMWQDMLDNPNIWVDATILLRPTMDHRQASTW